MTRLPLCCMLKRDSVDLSMPHHNTMATCDFGTIAMGASPYTSTKTELLLLVVMPCRYSNGVSLLVNDLSHKGRIHGQSS